PLCTTCYASIISFLTLCGIRQHRAAALASAQFFIGVKRSSDLFDLHRLVVSPILHTVKRVVAFLAKPHHGVQLVGFAPPLDDQSYSPRGALRRMGHETGQKK